MPHKHGRAPVDALAVFLMLLDLVGEHEIAGETECTAKFDRSGESREKGQRSALRETAQDDAVGGDRGG